MAPYPKIHHSTSRRQGTPVTLRKSTSINLLGFRQRMMDKNERQLRDRWERRIGVFTLLANLCVFKKIHLLYIESICIYNKNQYVYSNVHISIIIILKGLLPYQKKGAKTTNKTMKHVFFRVSVGSTALEKQISTASGSRISSTKRQNSSLDESANKRDITWCQWQLMKTKSQ